MQENHPPRTTAELRRRAEQRLQAAFQTLGLQNKKYTPAITCAGRFYAIVVPLGFIIIPIYFLFIR